MYINKNKTLYSTYTRTPDPESYSEKIKDTCFVNPVFKTTKSNGYGEVKIVGDTKDCKNKCIILEGSPRSTYKETTSSKFETTKTLTGNFCLFIGFSSYHYGHNTHDNIPIFQTLKTQLPPDTKFLIPEDNRILKEQLILIDPEWLDRLVEYPVTTPIQINGSVNFLCHAEYKLPHSFNHVRNYRADLRRALNKHEQITKQEHIIFCPRINDNGNGRGNSQSQIDEIIKTIESVCTRSNIDAKISIFKHEEYRTVSEQRRFFKDATVIIGIHGTALTNMLWADRFSSYTQKPLQIIEGVGLTEAYKQYAHFQDTNDNGYHRLFADGFNVQWRHFFCHPKNNTFKEVDIDLENIKNALVDSLEV